MSLQVTKRTYYPAPGNFASLAKRRLLDPSERITEIAYDIGYQSLSQFNRSFHRIVGESPTLFRKRMGVGKTAVALVA